MTLVKRGRRRRAMQMGVLLAAVMTAGCTSGTSPGPAVGTPTSVSEPGTTSADPEPPPSTTAPMTPHPYGTVPGLLTFRGNPTRTYYGQGPVPRHPRILWEFPDRKMCSMSTEGNVTQEWCGTGWTGQPAVAERHDQTWVVFGAYDRAVHFLAADTGDRLRADFPTGDLIKGSVTFDPDGFPLVYTGSRDDYFRVIAFDRGTPVELWSLAADAVSPRLWNDDWDGSALVLDDHLLIGGENSQWHAVKLNRSYGGDGLVTVNPELVFHAPGWDDQLLRDLGDAQVSIESSVTVWRDTLYFANSGGLVQGWDISGLRSGSGSEPTQTFRFWTGDDTDATVVVDDEGMLYVASEWERRNARARQVGQILKLDPRRENPVVWSIADQTEEQDKVAGVWATPALHRDLVIVPTNGGNVLGIDRARGTVRWTKQLPGPVWQSPVVVDDVLLQGDCHGILHAYDVSNTGVDPPELWSLPLGGCIESTPAVWNGRIYVGTRAGYFLALGDA
jgi:outer membrane protein assembly factor BamB